ncbi:MAG: protein kinase [Candidatus Solibacter sp.]
MDAQRWQRIEQIYHDALQYPAADRQAFLGQACGGDAELRAEVSSLLQQSSEGMLDRPVWQAVGGRHEGSMIGRSIAHFEIVGRLGEGGMGAVYKARDRHLDRDVALKVLLPETLSRPDLRRRFVQEAKAASALNHPNIIHVYDVDEAGGELFIAMEYVAGRTLDQEISHRGLPLRQALGYAVPIASALAKAHASGIVHRDLKPTNIMITEEHTVKVLDFGLAKLTEDRPEDLTGTREGTVLGTAAYMSPEQAEGRPVDPRSDIFSFGAVLYEMVTGERAFAGASRMATISAVLRDEPKPPSEIREGLPSELERVIARCLRKDPARRFQHMEDLRVALEELKEESEAALPAVAVKAARRVAPVRRWVAGGVIAAICVAGFLWKYGLPAGGRPPGAAETVQVTTSPGVAIGASFSPDSKRIAYSSNRSGWFEIYARDAGPRGEERQVTKDGQQNTDPAWSPDGKSIAYHSVAQHGIWVIAAEGGTPRQISGFGSSPAWSPDGGQLAFRSYEPTSLASSDWPGDGDSTIWTVAADGSRLQQVTNRNNPPGQHADPAWSPDGRRIVFASMGIITMGFRGVLWMVDPVSAELQPVAQNQIWAGVNPVFAPDGRGIYFAGRPKYDAPSGVYYVPLNGEQKPVELCRTRQAAPSRLSVARNGKVLAFTRLVNASQIWITGEAGADGRPLYQDAVVRARVPNFSPDGKRLTVQVQSDDSSLGIWLMDADGRNSNVFRPEAGNSNSANWNADSSALILNLFSSVGQRVVRFGLTDGSRRTLWETDITGARIHITPDEQELVYDTGRPRNIWKLKINGAQAKQLTFDRERAWFPEVSWDGQWIVYQVGRGDSSEIAVMDRNGGQQQILTPEPGKRFSHSFASDNRRIAYAGFEKGVWNLYWIDRITRERRQITHHTAYGSFVRSPAWRPGTEQMAYEFSGVKGNIELLPLAR